MRRVGLIFGWAVAVIGFAMLVLGLFGPQLDPAGLAAEPSLFMASVTQLIVGGGFLFLGGLLCLGLARKT